MKSTTTNTKPTWSGQLSFSSPEADFTSHYIPNTLTENDRSRLVATPSTTAVSSSSSSILSSFISSIAGRNKAAASTAATYVPKTFKEALQSHKEAIVVTTATAPFTILYVNEAWEKMCGYTSAEVIDHTLDCIQGPETNVTLATSSVAKLLVADQVVEETSSNTAVEPIDMYLINYKKDGSPFTNHLTIGTMTLNEDNDEPHFLVGVLEEISPDQVPLRMI